MLRCIPNLFLWNYPGNVQEECSETENFMRQFFLHTEFPEFVEQYRKGKTPLAIGSYSDLVWYVIYGRNSTYILGPAFITAISPRGMEEQAQKFQGAGMEFTSKRPLIRCMKQLPVISQKELDDLALMLHYCINQQRLTQEQLRRTIDKKLEEADYISTGSYQLTWEYTNRLMQYLEQGDASILSSGELKRIQVEGILWPTESAGITKVMHRANDAALAFIAQCAQAAVKGGLTPEKVYRIADDYVYTIEKQRSAMELDVLLRQLYQRYMQLIVEQRNHKNVQYSLEINKCMDYIANHLDQRLDIKELAAMAGYGDYYLARKFKKETGMELTGYIKKKRLERGRLLLATTELTIEEIAERLQFCSRSHFSDSFRKEMGMPPSQVRKKVK